MGTAGFKGQRRKFLVNLKIYWQVGLMVAEGLKKSLNQTDKISGSRRLYRENQNPPKSPFTKGGL
jgi:hypothetical protein